MLHFRRKPSVKQAETPSVVEQGWQDRHFLPGVTYALPKDLPEHQRLDFQHYLLHAVIGADYLAPIDERVSQILDVATGTGRWVLDIARAFPTAHVVGFDLEPPVRGTAPSNCTFVQGNLFAGLPFADDLFDFVHQRFLVLALPAIQWPLILSELRRVTRPGGYVELVEGGGTFLNRGPATRQLQEWWGIASTVYGIDVSLMAHVASLLGDAGFQAIHHQTYRVPVGSWGNRLGTMLQTDILASLPALKPFICKNAQVEGGAFETIVAALPAEWKTHHTCYEYYLAYGQRGL